MGAGGGANAGASIYGNGGNAYGGPGGAGGSNTVHITGGNGTSTASNTTTATDHGPGGFFGSVGQRLQLRQRDQRHRRGWAGVEQRADHRGSTAARAATRRPGGSIYGNGGSAYGGPGGAGGSNTVDITGGNGTSTASNTTTATDHGPGGFFGGVGQRLQLRQRDQRHRRGWPGVEQRADHRR